MDEAALEHVSIARRGYDARRRNGVALVYTLDAQITDEAAILRRHATDGHITATPDTRYRFVTHAPQNLTERPIVIGAGPCGLMAALTLAQMGFRPIVLDRGKTVRERTKDTWGPLAPVQPAPGEQRAIRRGRRRHLLRRQAL